MYNNETAAGGKKMNNKKTYGLVITALFAAIIILMAFVPYLGYLNLVLIKATIIHVPVIIGSIILGPKKGALLGFIFGLTSLINNTFNPSLLSFAFSPFYNGGNALSLVICFIPRILVGVVPYFVFEGMNRLLKKLDGKSLISLPVAAVAGSLTNTLLVMPMIYLFFRTQFAAAKGISTDAVLGVVNGIIAANGIPEAFVAAVIVTVVSMALIKLGYRR